MSDGYGSNVTTPDTCPRCGGEGIVQVQKERVVSGYGSNGEEVPLLETYFDVDGCPDCAQPAPTPSGDDEAYQVAMKARAEADIRRAIEQGVTQFGYEIVLDALDTAADALQEARDGWRLANETAEQLLLIASRAEAAEARLRALQEEANTTARWARGAEVALRQERARLREVEGVLNVVRVWATAAPHDPEEEAELENAVKRALLHFDVTQAAASRPVPAAPRDPNEHTADCAWTLATCEYKETHHYCPHAEHACSCQGVR